MPGREDLAVIVWYAFQLIALIEAGALFWAVAISFYRFAKGTL